jgi:hypothetical protein
LKCLCHYREKIENKISGSFLFNKPPIFDFYPEDTCCNKDLYPLYVLKTEPRKVITLQIGTFKARETVKVCRKCGRIHRSKQLCRLVAPSCNFGYDVLVYVGNAIFLHHLPDLVIAEQLSRKNIHISASEIAYLGKKFIAYLTLAHRNSASRIRDAMSSNGGYILHLDATYEENSPLLMCGVDSIMQIVLGNAKMRSEKSDTIIPFLHDIKDLFGQPLALVHDMSAGIIKAVGKVFPNTLDFICHFHFLRDIGKDLLEKEYGRIRKRLKHHGITSILYRRMHSLKPKINDKWQLIDFVKSDQQSPLQYKELIEHMPIFEAFSLIYWALDGKKQGNGYGFPFDRPHFEFVKRLKTIHDKLDRLRKIQLRGTFKDNVVLHKIYFDISPVINDKSLWKNVGALEVEIKTFENLREVLRIAPATSKKGLNDDGLATSVSTIKKGVKEFKKTITNANGYKNNKLHQEMIKQMEKYWEKLFADPIKVQTPEGTKLIQPQRTNNLAERNFRDLKRGYRKKTGNGSLGKILRSMLANTPLVKNLKNENYMKILLNGKSNLEDLFAEIDAAQIRNELKVAQNTFEKVPAKFKELVGKPDYPDILNEKITEIESNGILC